MNSHTILVLVFAIALVGAQDYKAIVAQITQTCAVEHGVTPEQIAQVKTTKNKSEISAPIELKCFAKCATLKSGMVVPGTGIDAARVIAFGVANGKDEAKLRAGIERCRKLYTGSETCEEYWDIYVCFNSEQ